MVNSLLTQKLLQIENKKRAIIDIAKARRLVSREEVKFSFWKEWLFKRKRWQPSRYRLGKNRLVMV